MRLAFTEEQIELRDAVRGYYDAGPGARVLLPPESALSPRGGA